MIDLTLLNHFSTQNDRCPCSAIQYILCATMSMGDADKGVPIFPLPLLVGVPNLSCTRHPGPPHRGPRALSWPWNTQGCLEEAGTKSWGKGRAGQTRDEGPVTSPTFPQSPWAQENGTFNFLLRSRCTALGLYSVSMSCVRTCHRQTWPV